MSKTIDDINQDFQEFQDELLIRSKKLKALITLKDDDELNDLIDLIDLPQEKRYYISKPTLL